MAKDTDPVDQSRERRKSIPHIVIQRFREATQRPSLRCADVLSTFYVEAHWQTPMHMCNGRFWPCSAPI